MTTYLSTHMQVGLITLFSDLSPYFKEELVSVQGKSRVPLLHIPRLGRCMTFCIPED